MPWVLVLPPRSKPPGFEAPGHLGVHQVDDRLLVRRLVGDRPLLRQGQTLIAALYIDQKTEGPPRSARG